MKSKNVIYYFSGTGNSLRTAIKIAEKIGGAELINVRCAPEKLDAKDMMRDKTMIGSDE